MLDEQPPGTDAAANGRDIVSRPEILIDSPTQTRSGSWGITDMSNGRCPSPVFAAAGRVAQLRGWAAMAATDVQHNPTGSDQSRQTAPIAVLPHQPRPRERVEQVLRTLPSHGWTAGWIGRRDRALLVLGQIAGLSYENAATMTAGDLHVADGAATIRTPGGKTTLRDVPDDDLLCGPCALARWVHALDLTVVYPDGRVIATVIARAVPLTPDSPHLCHSSTTITEITRRAALLPPIDRWGHPARAGQPSFRGVRAPATTRRAFAAVQHTPPGPPSTTPDVAHRARALQIRVEQLLDRTA
jgi:hypothetical protein